MRRSIPSRREWAGPAGSFLSTPLPKNRKTVREVRNGHPSSVRVGDDSPGGRKVNTTASDRIWLSPRGTVQRGHRHFPGTAWETEGLPIYAFVAITVSSLRTRYSGPA
jgi:hypothetical protein